MEKFIYVFDTETRDKLLTDKFTFICKSKLGNKECYVFENNQKAINFSKDDKKKLIFSNMMYF